MTAQLQFTRYLYAKDEAEVSFLISLLKKNEKALFWAYELFHSGYDLCGLFWKVYYDFYATVNPAFEKYLATKMKQGLDEHSVCAIVKNFIIRRYNTDVFMVRNIVKQFDIERQDNKGILELIEKMDFMAIGSFILEHIPDSELVENYKLTLEYFVTREIRIDVTKAITEFNKSPLRRIVFLAKVIHYFSVLKQVKMGRNLYIQIEDEQTNIYKTLEGESGRCYKVLPIARKYNIDDDNYLSLFKLARETTDVTEAFRENWMFHASFSPLWSSRIESHGGLVIQNKVTFEKEDDEEKFNERFNLEPDEQKLEVQEKSTGKIKQERGWLSFYKEHKCEGIVDVDEELLRQIEKVAY
ncbi:MAG: hypothetical protein WCO72_14950 [Betaproteobacteria bacterium]